MVIGRTKQINCYLRDNCHIAGVDIELTHEFRYDIIADSKKELELYHLIDDPNLTDTPTFATVKDKKILRIYENFIKEGDILISRLHFQAHNPLAKEGYHRASFFIIERKSGLVFYDSIVMPIKDIVKHNHCNDFKDKY